MSLLRRIESARPAAEMLGTVPADPALPPSPTSPPPARPATGLERLPGTGPSVQGAPGQGNTTTTGRMLAQVPLRESFRDAKFRIQQRVIGDIDPKLDLANAVEVRREIEEAFGRALDAEGLALTRAERTRMLEQITDEIVGLGPLEPLLRDEGITEVMVNGPRQV
jgi:pilus assembly protein CpaF